MNLKQWHLVLILSVVFLCMPSAARAQLIDHNSVDSVASLPQSVMDAIGQQRWFFTHASVGSNMLNGMTALRTADPVRYQLQVSSVGYNSTLLRANPPGVTTRGRIYECARGNPGWSTKLDIFDNSVRDAGWRYANVDIAMDKFCYIDQNASAAEYLDLMEDLEADYPDTRFVYVTMPIMTSEDRDNRLRGDYNEAVRQYCLATGKLLFDIADIEAHDPDGNAYTFEYNGATYQKLYSGYTDDGGHLNAAGRLRVALGWYATGAALAVVPASVVDRHIFYNHSAWDGNDTGADAADDDAIASDKTALLPGQVATFANYTSYSRGINGFMIDIAGLADPASLTAADFEFRTGNNADPAGWSLLTLNPSLITIAVRPGDGVAGSDRVTVLFADGAIKKTWLQVTVQATDATGLAVPDVHFWGNAVGDSGDSTTDTAVNVVDALGVRANPHTLLRPAPIDDLYDYNRDKQVNVQDELLVRANPTTLLTDLELIDLSGYGGGGSD